MEINRLERLASLLDGYASNVEFNLQGWGHRWVQRRWFWSRGECATSACAVGVACLDQGFRDEGLDYEWQKVGVASYRLMPLFDRHESWDAVGAFFGVDNAYDANNEREPSLASRLFDPIHYRITKGPEAARLVARRIRAAIRLERYKQRKDARHAAFEQMKQAALLMTTDEIISLNLPLIEQALAEMGEKLGADF